MCVLKAWLCLRRDRDQDQAGSEVKDRVRGGQGRLGRSSLRDTVLVNSSLLESERESHKNNVSPWQPELSASKHGEQ